MISVPPSPTNNTPAHQYAKSLGWYYSNRFDNMPLCAPVSIGSIVAKEQEEDTATTMTGTTTNSGWWRICLT